MGSLVPNSSPQAALRIIIIIVGVFPAQSPFAEEWLVLLEACVGIKVQHVEAFWKLKLWLIKRTQTENHDWVRRLLYEMGEKKKTMLLQVSMMDWVKGLLGGKGLSTLTILNETWQGWQKVTRRSLILLP